ncbi:MAG TPA: DUF1015 domain-containing protein [Actinomycetota bacterium]|nr:DUF1015 domain-containing protein [Actinomycetota bacterium]
MPRISPFVGLLFDPARVGSLERVTTPPYDIVTPEERRAFLEASPYNVIRLDLSGDAPGADKYMGAAGVLRGWRDERALAPTPEPVYFPYEMRFSLDGRTRQVRGFVCRVELEPWGGSVVPHERTMAGPIEDRLQLLRATRANLSCVYAIHPGPVDELRSALEDATSAEPPYRSVDGSGVEHRMWVVPGDHLPAGVLADRSLLIADGHHRYATALRFREEMRESRGAGPWDHVMMLVVDEAGEDPPVFPYHRLVQEEMSSPEGTPVNDLDELLTRLDDDALVYGIVTRNDAGVSHRIATLPGPPPTVRALHERILDGRVSEAALRFTRDPREAERIVSDGGATTAFLLPPTSAERIRKVVDRGETLPQKSTFFWPKPLTGMVIRPLDETPEEG